MRRRAWAVLLLSLVGAASGQVGGFPLLASDAAAAEPGMSWTWPLAGAHTVSRPFLPPPTRYAAGHRGADLPAAVAAPVLAAAAGRVSYAGQIGGRGVVVVVHGDLRTTYEPVAASVAVGAQVAAGGEIGRLQAGHAGCPAAACLHWGLRRGEDYLDPVRTVDRGPARLLPLGEPVPGAGGGLPGGGLPGAGLPGAGLPGGGLPGAGLPGGGLPSGAAGAAAEPPAGPAAEAVPAVPLVGPRPGPEAPPPVASTWSLRAVQTPAGLAALAALLFGIGLLTRRRPGPDDPAGGSAGAPGPVEEAGPDALVLQLDKERLRRRAG